MVNIFWVVKRGLGRRAHGERQYRTEEKASHLVKNGNKMRMRQKKEGDSLSSQQHVTLTCKKKRESDEIKRCESERAGSRAMKERVRGERAGSRAMGEESTHGFEGYAIPVGPRAYARWTTQRARRPSSSSSSPQMRNFSRKAQNWALQQLKVR